MAPVTGANAQARAGSSENTYPFCPAGCGTCSRAACRRCASFRLLIVETGIAVQGRRRLVLLAAIIVAVAIGAVGIAIVSLFEASLGETRDAVVARLDDMAAGARPGNHSASLALVGEEWRVALGSALPPAIAAALPSRPETGGSGAGGEAAWLDTPQYLAALRPIDAQAVVVAWVPLADIRAPFHRAALYAAAGIALLLAIGLALFYRMTAPLLRSIERSEERYRTLFANTAEGVLLIGDGIEECNERFCEMFGCRASDVLGLPWRVAFSRLGLGGERDLDALGRQVDAAVAEGSGLFSWRLQRPGRPLQVVDIALRRLAGAASRKGPYVLVSLRDITAREESARVLREAEQALHESREKLAQAGRSSALVELAAGIAHEVNQPLAAIANYARACRRLLVSGKPAGDDLVRTLDRIDEQAQRAGAAIHRIRSLVSNEPGPGSNQACINRLVREVIELMGEEIAQHGAQVEVDEGADVPVFADPAQIQQVVVQLLRNALEAVDAVPPEERVVRIATRRQGDFVEVDIEDRGAGLAPDDQERIFEPFYSTKERGLGMGLPISMSIIRSHRGELVVDEACDRGTRFRFRLPADLKSSGCRPQEDRVAV